MYESFCTICHPGGKKDDPEDKMVTTVVGVYTGETSRSLKERAGEHVEAARKLDRGPHDQALVLDPPRGGGWGCYHSNF